MLQLNYRDAKPIYEQIKEGIRHLLLTNAIAADEKLPSVRELASMLAREHLRLRQILYTKVGSRSF